MPDFNAATYQQDVIELQNSINAANLAIAALDGPIKSKQAEIDYVWQDSTMRPSCSTFIWGSGSPNTCSSVPMIRLGEGRQSDDSTTGTISSSNVSNSWELSWFQYYKDLINGLVSQRKDLEKKRTDKQNDINAYTIQLNNLKKAYTDYTATAANAAATVLNAQTHQENVIGFQNFLDKYGLLVMAGLVVIVFIYFKYRK